MNELEYDHCSAKFRSSVFFKLANIPVVFKDMETWGAVQHLKKILLDEVFQELSQKNLQFYWNRWVFAELWLLRIFLSH